MLVQFWRFLNLLDRPLDCGALEAKFQQLAAGKKAGIRIKVDITAANIPDVDESDVRKTKRGGLGKPETTKS